MGGDFRFLFQEENSRIGICEQAFVGGGETDDTAAHDDEVVGGIHEWMTHGNSCRRI